MKLQVTHDTQLEKSRKQLKEYIVIDLEYSSKHKMTGNVADFLPIQLSAIHFKNGRIDRKTFNRPIVDKERSTMSDIFRAMSRTSQCQAKHFEKYSSITDVYHAFKQWLLEFNESCPILLVGAVREITYFCKAVNSVTNAEHSIKVRNLRVVRFSQCVYSLLDFHHSFTHPKDLGLNSFDEFLHASGMCDLIRSKNGHDAFDDCVLTNQLMQLILNNRTRPNKFSRLVRMNLELMSLEVQKHQLDQKMRDKRRAIDDLAQSLNQ